MYYFRAGGSSCLEAQLPIPPFGPSGVLPEFDQANPGGGNRSPYDASTIELVQRFATTPERKELLGKLIAYRQLLASGGYVSGYQFINGSFVEDVELIRGRAPRDIDVVSFLHMPQQYVNDLNAWAAAGFPFWRDEVANRTRNKGRFSLDTFAIALSSASYREFTYWHGLFSHQRDTFAWKGYIVVPIDAALTAMRSTNWSICNANPAFTRSP
jgi:hypothetical protein